MGKVQDIINMKKKRGQKSGLGILLAAAMVFQLFPFGSVPAAAAIEQEEECICAYLCGQDSVNGDCPVCGMQDAGFLSCAGKEDRNYAQDADQKDQDAANESAQAEREVSVSYQKADWNGSEVIYSAQTADQCIPVTDSTEAVIWESGWYVVNSHVTVSEPITIQGEVNLILADGCKLDAGKGIVVTVNNSLTIYAQSGGSGELYATGVYEGYSASAGIGGSITSVDSGDITIHGGVIRAVGGSTLYSTGGTGIGGGSSMFDNGGSSGAVTIYGGDIQADSGTGNFTAAGIGGGYGSRGGNGSHITVYGGSVSASSCSRNNSSGAGIGGGGAIDSAGGDGSSIMIYGGTVSAAGGECGAGIGGGGGAKKSGNGSDIMISGGVVTAVGGNYAADIGGGGGYISKYLSVIGGLGRNIRLEGGIVNARGGQENNSSYKGEPIGNGGNADASVPSDVVKTSGIIFEQGTGTVYGDVVFTGAYEVPADCTLNIPIGASLAGSGTLTGGGEFRTENFTEDVIVVPKNLTYTGADYTGQVKLADSVTICGAPFLINTEGWDYSIEPATVQNARSYTVTCTKDAQTVNKVFEVAKSDLKTAVVKLSVDSYIYDGTEKTPEVTVEKDGNTIDAGEYDIAYTGSSGDGSHTDAGMVTVTVTAKENSNYSGSCSAAFTIAPAALTESMVTLSAASTVYNGAEQRPAVAVLKEDGTALAEGADYEVSCSPKDFINAGTVRIAVTGKGNYAGTIEKAYTIGCAVPAMAWGSARTQELVYSGKPAAITPPEVRLLNQEEFAGTMNYSYAVSGSQNYISGLPTDAGNYTVRASIAQQGNYTAADSTDTLDLTIGKAQGVLTVPNTTIHKKFRDADFSLACTTNGDGRISYASDKESVALVSTDGTVQIKGVGTAEITVSLAEGTNYTKDLNQKVQIIVAKADQPEIAGITKQYVSTKGSSGKTAEIDVAEQFPKDGGATAYTCTRLTDPDSVLEEVAVDADTGKLTYRVKNTGKTGSAAFIEVTAEMDHYEDAVCTVKIEIVDKIKVVITAEAEDAGYDGSRHKGYKDGISCDYPVSGYTYAYTGRDGTVYDSAQPPLDAGNYTVTIQAADASGDYEGFTAVDFTIAKALIIVRADDKTAKTGDPVPELTYTASGLAGKDRFAVQPQLSCSADMKTAGVYPITAGGAKVPDANNYVEDIAYEEGKLTVSSYSGSGSTGSSGNTGSSGGSWSPGSTGGSWSLGSTGGSSSGSSTAAEEKQPFLKDSSGREGWDAIRAETEKAAAAAEGGTVTVEMNGASKVPGSVLREIKGRDVTLTFDMGGGVVWSVNGKDLTAETVGDIDFSVQAGTGRIPQEVIDSMSGNFSHLELNLAHDGEFGFTAVLTIRITETEGGIAVGSGTPAGYTGMYANLFYYNPARRSLEFVCAGRIGEDGTARLPFVHASDYMVVVSAQPLGTAGDAQEPEKPQEPGQDTRAQVKSVKLSKTVYTYSGKAKKPSVLALDTDGKRILAKYYTVSYQNNKKVGKAAVTVRFKGRYSGTVKKTFTIRPAATSVKKLTAVSGGFTIKWKKQTAQTDGYQIQYSRDAGFQGSSTRSVFMKKASAGTYTADQLKKGKNYYVRIRTYKTVKENGKSTKIYSAWSSTGRVKTALAASQKHKES